MRSMLTRVLAAAMIAVSVFFAVLLVASGS